MKLRIELEIDLGDNFIDPNDKEERDWLFNHILTEANLFLHDNEIGDTIGDIKKVIKCEEVGQSEQLSCGRNITTCVFYKDGGKCSNLEYCRDQTT